MDYACIETEIDTYNEEKTAVEILQNFYRVITDKMIGVYPIEFAKKVQSSEFKKAKECAIISLEFAMSIATDTNYENQNIDEVLRKIKTY